MADGPPRAIYPDLAGKRVLITGAAAGIGLAMAKAFAAQQATSILFDQDEAVTDAVAAIPSAHAVLGSVTNMEDVSRAFEETEARLGPVDIAVVNAGIAMNKPTLELSPADWDRVLAVNLTGAFLTAREAGRRMIARGTGVILFTGSMYGLVAAPERLGYCVTKSGVLMMAKALAIEWAGYGVRVDAIAPGYVRTALVDELVARGRLDPERIAARTPIGRLIEPDEVADAALFLASDAGRAITGQVLGVDGGWTAYGYI